MTDTVANRLRFLASELTDEASRHDPRHREVLARAAQQCATCAISVGNLQKRSSVDHDTVRKTIAAAEAIITAAVDALVAAAILRTPELHPEGTHS